MSQTPGTAPSQDLETTELIQRAASGDVEAYGQVYSICVDRIYRYVFNQIRNVMLAEDITEEVFIKAWKAVKSCKGKEQTFIPWLYRIAHNCTVDMLRKRSKDISLEFTEAVEDGDAIQLAEDSLEWQRVVKLISALPEQQKQIIILKFLDGADNREIEKITGKHQGAIRALQMRAMINLRQRISAEVGRNDA
jgi:RNA polymerase sigma-70 factor (ECF subfamily)